MPNSACTAGSTTETTDIALLPSVTSSTVTSSRQAAVRESIRLASAGPAVLKGQAPSAR